MSGSTSASGAGAAVAPALPPTERTHLQVLVVSANSADRHLLQRALEVGDERSVRVRSAADLDAAEPLLSSGQLDCLIIDLDHSPEQHPGDRLESVARLRTAHPAVALLTISALDALDLALRAVAAGAQEHLCARSIDPERMRRSVRLAVARQQTHPARDPGPSEAEHVHDAALQRERERIRLLLEHSNDVIMLFREDGAIEWVSPSSTRVLGVEPEVLVGCNGFDLIHPDDLDRCVAELVAPTVTGVAATVQFRSSGVLGPMRWLEETVSDLRAYDDLGFIVANLRDVTERREAEESLRFQSRVLSTIGEAVAATDARGRITYLNPAAEKLYGWPLGDALGRNGGELSVDAGDGERILDRQIRSGRSWAGDMWLKRRDGSTFYGHVTNTPLVGDDGENLGLIGVTTDLTERLQLVRAADADRRRLADAQRSAQLGSYEVDLSTFEVTWSSEMYRIVGLTPGDPVDLDTYFQFVHPEDLPALRNSVDRGLLGEPTPDIEYRIVRTDGAVRWILASTSWMHGDPPSMHGTVLDITERHLAEQRLEHEVLHDPLTGLPNRVEITRQIDRLLARQRDGGPPVTIAFCDLDRFKVINDGLGHGTGDEVLLEVADRLRRSVPVDATVGRFGGDEFVVILPGPVDTENALASVDEVMTCLDHPIEIGERQFFVSASVGVTISADGDEPASLLQAADTAMYESKGSAEQRVTFFDERLRRRSTWSLEIETDLRRAIEHDEFEVHYQPIVHIDDGRCVGFEGLLRWNHPRLGTVPPDDFIPVAEDSGAILAIGAWVLDDALARIAEWNSSGEHRLWAAVNVSAQQLIRRGLADQVEAAVHAAGVDPSLVHLEITESVLMDRIDGSLATLSALRDLGVRLSVDDFGTGYSSLSYLKRLPIHTLKIDRSFTDGLGDDPDDTSIVRAISGLSDALSLDLVAEGVETEGQRAALARLGCEFGQGYLWAPPMSADRVGDWLRDRPDLLL